MISVIIHILGTLEDIPAIIKQSVSGSSASPADALKIVLDLQAEVQKTTQHLISHYLRPTSELDEAAIMNLAKSIDVDISSKGLTGAVIGSLDSASDLVPFIGDHDDIDDHVAAARLLALVKNLSRGRVSNLHNTHYVQFAQAQSNHDLAGFISKHCVDSEMFSLLDMNIVAKITNADHKLLVLLKSQTKAKCWGPI